MLDRSKQASRTTWKYSVGRSSRKHFVDKSTGETLIGRDCRKDDYKSISFHVFRIFANIKSIFNFHKNEFLPSLRACSDDPVLIAEVFTSFITRDDFYGYIIYAINRKRSELLCNYDGQFWKVTKLRLFVNSSAPK